MANGPDFCGGIFGPSTTDVLAMQRLERLRNAQIFGQLGTAGAAAIGGDLLGSGINQLFGAQDPQLERARRLQAVQQDLADLEPGTEDYTRTALRSLRARIGPEAAAQALPRLAALEKERAELEELRQGPLLAQRGAQRRAALLSSIGLPDGLAILAADDPQLTRELAKQALSPEEATTLQRELAATGQPPEAQRQLLLDILKRRAEGPGPAVQVFNAPTGFEVDPSQPGRLRAIPGGPADPELRAEQAAASREATLTAGEKLERAEVLAAEAQVRAIARGLSAADLVPFSTARKRYNNAVRRLAKAVAQKRNPGDAEASQLAEEALVEDFPGIEFAFSNPQAVNALVNDLAAEARGAPVGGAEAGLSPKARALLERARKEGR